MSSSFIVLPVIPRLWASGGETQNPIPEQATGTNRASYQEGFPAITSEKIADGGIPPNRLDFNGMGTIFTAYAYAAQTGQYTTFNNSVSTKIGGYPLGAILWYVSNGVPQYLVQSLVANNTTSDLTDTTKWQPLTLSPMGCKLLSQLANLNTAQVRNIEFVDEEPVTGVDGTIYAVLKNA